MIAPGLQEKFSWRAVAAGAISGAFAGAAQGIKPAAKAGALATTLKMNTEFAKVAAVALKVASVAVRQIIETVKINSWTSLAVAGIGRALRF